MYSVCTLLYALTGSGTCADVPIFHAIHYSCLSTNSPACCNYLNETIGLSPKINLIGAAKSIFQLPRIPFASIKLRRTTSNQRFFGYQQYKNWPKRISKSVYVGERKTEREGESKRYTWLLSSCKLIPFFLLTSFDSNSNVDKTITFTHKSTMIFSFCSADGYLRIGVM